MKSIFSQRNLIDETERVKLNLGTFIKRSLGSSAPKLKNVLNNKKFIRDVREEYERKRALLLFETKKTAHESNRQETKLTHSLGFTDKLIANKKIEHNK